MWPQKVHLHLCLLFGWISITCACIIDIDIGVDIDIGRRSKQARFQSQMADPAANKSHFNFLLYNPSSGRRLERMNLFKCTNKYIRRRLQLHPLDS
jgi:hypothetical protein